MRTLLTARPPRALPLAVSLLLALPLAGCGGGGGGSNSTFTSAPASSPQSVSAATPSGLTATLAEDKDAIRTGDGVNYTLTLTNNTAQPITFQSILGPETEAATVGGALGVKDASGGGVFPISPPAGSGGISIGPTTTLAPGQSVSGTVSPGNVFAKSGTYSATASFGLQTITPPLPNASATVGPLTINVQ